ncbi:hypothetical protein NESM_000349100 [Novymonas esmeraldas]|uniref:RRM domain-containing protein n=1 Tax=Novymonas esmeraldas TaxID=1808958 RepID=A0AAW0EJK4_9TRYP
MPTSTPSVKSPSSTPRAAPAGAAKRSAPAASKSKAAPSLASRTNPTIYHGSVLLHNLPVHYKNIYSHSIRRFFSPAQRQHMNTEVRLIEEIGNATMCVEVDSKETAQLMFRQLQNRNVYGRRWKVQYVPTAATVCSSEACLVDCFLVPAAPQALAERALAGVPGFLAFIETPDAPLPTAASAAAASPIRDADNNSDDDNMDGGDGVEAGGQRHKLLVSFADEGSALHARAVLSGRLVGTSGVRMFLERRRSSAAAQQ